MSLPAETKNEPPRRDPYLVLACCFLGWMFAGMEMGLMPLVARTVSMDLMGSAFNDAAASQWFAWYTVAFLLGGAVGGLLFGWLGDQFGRTKAMAGSILCYAVLTGLGFFVGSQEHLLVLRFLASLGIGGMWPCGVSLFSEFWGNVSRPTLAGVFGVSANVGIVLMGLTGTHLVVTPQTWRTIMLVGAAPTLLGVLVLLVCPESPKWLAGRSRRDMRPMGAPVSEVFRPPLLRLTLIGICLATIPLLGAWGSGKWLIPWADKAGGIANPDYKATAQLVWAVGAALGSLTGGWLANRFGRRLTYFFISLGSLAVNGGIYRFMQPGEGGFLPAVFVLGLISTVFFGWLPLYLPELFPTRVRATGTGVTYNFGRFASAAGVLCAGLLARAFGGDYAVIGGVTSLVYAFGMLVIWFAPDTTDKGLQE